MTGGVCELEAGHDGKHRKTVRDWHFDAPPERYGSVIGVYEWTDAEVSEQVKRHSSRFD
jgi:hypothetical protein